MWAGLAAAAVVGEARWQVFDLPAIRLRVVEHRAQRRMCGCGAVTGAPFPPEATAPTRYGPAVAALGVYLLARQHLPVDRAARCLADCFGAPVSTGYLAGLLPAAAARLTDFCARTRAELAAAAVVGVDQTGGRVAAGLWWVHVACTDRRTLYHLDPHRGQAAMDAAGVLPHCTGIVVHDAFAPYARYPAATHAVCNAHLLRELIAVVDHHVAHPDAGADTPLGWCWARQVIDALLALEAITDTGAFPDSDVLAAHRRLIISAALIGASAQAGPPGAIGRRHRALARRIRRRLEDYLRFAVDPRVPFDNNLAERDIRMAKIKQKVSGCLRTLAGAQDFAAMRSYLSTAAKHGRRPFDVLTELTSGNVWIPATT